MEKNIQTITPANRAEWREWLQKNHKSETAVWFVYYKKNSQKVSISWSDAVDEALCFGWIDSIRKTLDQDRFIQFFSKRKPKGTWSKINKIKIEQLVIEGLMTKAGFESIESAKQNGSWTLLDEVEELTIPEDLAQSFKIYGGSEEFFLSLSKSVKKMMLQWITLAKRPETRQKRVMEIVEMASQKLKPTQFR